MAGSSNPNVLMPHPLTRQVNGTRSLIALFMHALKKNINVLNRRLILKIKSGNCPILTADRLLRHYYAILQYSELYYRRGNHSFPKKCKQTKTIFKK